MSQNQTGSGSVVDYIPGPDWSNIIVTSLAFIFSIFTYINQKSKDRKAATEAEKMRQQTVRLEWYREAIRARLENSYKTFDQLHSLGQEFDNSILDDAAINAFVKPYKKYLFDLRDDALEPILFIHSKTYNTLKKQIDDLIETTTTVIFEREGDLCIVGNWLTKSEIVSNSSLLLSTHIGVKINNEPDRC